MDIDHSTNNDLSSKVLNAFHVAVGENWLLGMTDYRIFSEHRLVLTIACQPIQIIMILINRLKGENLYIEISPLLLLSQLVWACECPKEYEGDRQLRSETYFIPAQ